MSIFQELLKKAEEGDAESQFIVGGCYRLGMGMEKSEERCAYWFHKAAESGIPEYQEKFGWLYLLGIGVEKSDEKALEWFEKASNQGRESAEAMVKSIKKGEQ